MSDTTPESALSKFRYEALFAVWLGVTGATFLRISRQPYSSRLKIEQYESIFKGTSLGAVLLGISITPGTRTARRFSTATGPGKAQLPRLGIPANITCASRNLQTCPLDSRTLHGLCIATMLFRVGSLSAEFNVWNPIYAFAPFVVLLISIPLTTFAVVTTSIAVALLAFRALVVYVQLGAAIIGAWILPPPQKFPSSRSPTTPSPSADRHSPIRQRQRHRRSSGSSQDTTIPTQSGSRLHKKSDSMAALIGTGEATRDFEGVGGWRVAGDDDEEALWMGINSRLQLPATVTTRRHQRSLTGGASPSQRWSWTPETLRMSPVQSRARASAPSVVDDTGGYFPLQAMSSIRPMSTSSDPVKPHWRRKSGSSSSTSSNTSVAGVIMAVKKVG